MMTFNETTKPRIQELLTLLSHSSRRIRIWYGDTETGRSWNEEHHVTGTVGRSTGTKKIPLILPNRRCSGGPSISDSSIIRIDDTNCRETLYKHPNFHTGLHVKDNEVYTYKDDKYTVQARFDHPFKAQKYVEFMEGKRYSK